MKYSKIVYNGIIYAAGEISNGIPITDNEYQSVINAFSLKPSAEIGYKYILHDLTYIWELIELPPIQDEVTDGDKAEAYDILIGGAAQ